MNRIVVRTQTGSDGSLHVDLPAGSADANADVQVTVDRLMPSPQRTLLASDLLHSGLVGLWAGRGDIGDSRDFARCLRERAQTRGAAAGRTVLPAVRALLAHGSGLRPCAAGFRRLPPEP
jgi:hypothetical protein